MRKKTGERDERDGRQRKVMEGEDGTRREKEIRRRETEIRRRDREREMSS